MGAWTYRYPQKRNRSERVKRKKKGSVIYTFQFFLRWLCYTDDDVKGDVKESGFWTICQKWILLPRRIRYKTCAVTCWTREMERLSLQITLSPETCFCIVTKIPSGMSIVILPCNDSVTSRGTGGLGGLDRHSVVKESGDVGTFLGIGRLTRGKRGGGERPCGSKEQFE